MLDEIETLGLELKLRRAAVQRVEVRLEELEKLKQSLSDYPFDKEMEPLIDKKFEIHDSIQTGEARLARLVARYKAQEGIASLLDSESDAARADMRNNVITAPFAGTVVKRVTDPARAVSEEIVCELWDESAFLIEAEMLQHQLAFLQLGRPALVALDFGRGESAAGVVESLDAASLIPDPSGHPKFKVAVRVEKPVSWLRPGMQVAVRVRSEGAK